MCEPTTIAILATSLISAAVAKTSADNMAASQAEAVTANQREAYRVGQEQEREAAQRSAEEMTDRSREAARQLSMARVIAAEGGGSLAARAINIGSGAAEDQSRIEVSRQNTVSSVRSHMAAGAAASNAELKSVQTQFKGNQMQFMGSVAGAAINAGANYHKRQTELKTAKNAASDYKVK